MKADGDSGHEKFITEVEKKETEKVYKELKEATQEIEDAKQGDSEGRASVNIFMPPENATARVQDSLPGKDNSKQSVKETMEEFVNMLCLIISKMEHDMNIVRDDKILENLAMLYSNMLRFRMIFTTPLALLSGAIKNEEFFDSYRLLKREILEKVSADNICNKYIQLCVAFMKKYLQEKVMPFLQDIQSLKNGEKSKHVGLAAEAQLLVSSLNIRTK